MATMGGEVVEALESAASEKTWTAKRERRIDHSNGSEKERANSKLEEAVLNCRDDESIR